MLRLTVPAGITVEAGGIIPLALEYQKGNTATLENNAIHLNAVGDYLINGNVSLTTTATGLETVTPIENGTAQTNASTETSASGATLALPINTSVRVNGVCKMINSSTLQFITSGAVTTVGGSIVVTKL